MKRFIYSHLGWLFKIEQPDRARYIPDLRADKDLKFISDLFPFWVLLSFIIPAVSAA